MDPDPYKNLRIWIHNTGIKIVTVPGGCCGHGGDGGGHGGGSGGHRGGGGGHGGGGGGHGGGGGGWWWGPKGMVVVLNMTVWKFETVRMMLLLRSGSPGRWTRGDGMPATPMASPVDWGESWTKSWHLPSCRQTKSVRHAIVSCTVSSKLKVNIYALRCCYSWFQIRIILLVRVQILNKIFGHPESGSGLWFRIRINFFRIRIQHSRLETNPDADTGL